MTSFILLYLFITFAKKNTGKLSTSSFLQCLENISILAACKCPIAGKRPLLLTACFGLITLLTHCGLAISDSNFSDQFNVLSYVTDLIIIPSVASYHIKITMNFAIFTNYILIKILLYIPSLQLGSDNHNSYDSLIKTSSTAIKSVYVTVNM